MFAFSPSLWVGDGAAAGLLADALPAADAPTFYYTSLGDAEGAHMEEGFDAWTAALERAAPPALRWRSERTAHAGHGSTPRLATPVALHAFWSGRRDGRPHPPRRVSGWAGGSPRRREPGAARGLRADILISCPSPASSPMEVWPEADVERVLEWYEKDPGEALVGDEPLRGISLDGLRDLFGPDPEDPAMYDVYEVEPREVERLQQAVDHRIDLDAYDYFVAAYQKGR